MNLKVIKQFLITTAILVCVMISPINTFASKVSGEEQELNIAYSTIKSIQKQLSSITEQIYSNKLEGKTTKENEKVLRFADTEIGELIKELNKYELTPGLSKLQSAKLQSLIASANILNYMSEVLIGYINTQDSVTQLQLLKEYFKLDAVLSQFIIDYSYLEENLPI